MTNIPLSTYRIQLNREFTFAQAAEIVPYLAALGISHVYASPYLRAREGSQHGYDIIDHHHLNPEIGTVEEYENLVAVLHENGMGQILDLVPNHMAVMGADNAWWLDVLENGEASAYADFFDIDWEPLKDELQGKVLVPVLADQYGTVLDRGELKLSFDQGKGEFSVLYFQHRFPVNPREYPRILTAAAELLQKSASTEESDVLELQSLIAAFGHLPSRTESSPEKRTERNRDKEINKKRLAGLCERSHPVAAAIESSVANMNGLPGVAGSFDALHELIKSQAFRLAYWRVAADDINYRRFFDVNDLAAVRQENETVFTQTHEFVLRMVKEGKIGGLRIDHPDGLYDPAEYFRRLQAKCCEETGLSDPLYVVAEKILSGREQLQPNWLISGTTGYDFANLVNGLFVDPVAEDHMTKTYALFIGETMDFKEQVYRCKKLVMDRLLNSELNVLANHLSRIALADRHTCDFTVKSLRDALTEVVACFPVYRTYISANNVSAADAEYISEAIEYAKHRSTSADSSVYDFIRGVLLTQQAEGHPQFYWQSVVRFAMRFQQYSSAVMAKGFEDTSLYRYHRLVSLNDVGGDPRCFGFPLKRFHVAMQQRAQEWPHAMIATSTHDSKRSEDVRARIDVLSEIPELWRERVTLWQRINKFSGRQSVRPSANDEYLFYQTLLGTWPLEQSMSEDFQQRINGYMLKAMREAKENTSWSNQNQEYEGCVTDFVTSAMQNQAFLADFIPFQQKISHFGMLNSLSQTVIRLTAPGVPDTYQGCETWQFNLVDPDNRRHVDYRNREAMLRKLQESDESDPAKYLGDLSSTMSDGRAKIFVCWKLLGLRQMMPDLFRSGTYAPVHIEGPRTEHVIAYRRVLAGEQIVVIVPRWCAKLLDFTTQMPFGKAAWKQTAIELSDVEVEYQEVFSGSVHRIEGPGAFLQIASVLQHFPVAVLRRR